MKIYRAESGQHVHWPRSVSIHTLDEFKQELEKCTGVPASNQILMTSFGQQVKQEQLDDILRATGKDEYIIFCYDRYYLGASREEISTLLDVDVPSVQPEVKPFDAKQLIKAIAKSPSANNIPGQCQQYLDMFAQFDSHSQALLETINQHTQLARTVVEEQKAQRMALNVAFENLDTHYRLIEKNVQVFYEGADKEYARQSTLLESTDADVAILRSIRIHPAFGQSRTHLIDFLDMEQLDTSRHDASELCQNIDFAMQQLRDVINELKHHEDDLQRQIDEDHDLQTLDALLVETIDIKDRAQFLRDKIKRDLHRIYERIANVIHVPLSTLLATLSLDDLGSMGKDTSLFDPPSSAGARDNGANGGGKKALEAIHSLADIHATDYLAKISSYELAIRQVLTKLIAIKRQSILAFLKNMNVISQLQSNIMQSQQVLNAARQQLTEFQQKYDTSYLETCRHILFAYGALLIEVVRRREFAKILKENATLMADVVGGFKEKEDDRRDYFRHDITMTLPFKIPALTNAAPQCEISTANVDESIPQITHQDIIDFVSLLDQAYARTMAKGGAPRSRGKDRLMQPNGTGPSPRSRKLITTDSYGQNLLQLLNSMNMQLDGLADEFLALIHATFFNTLPGGLSTSLTAFGSQSSHVATRQLTSALQQANDRVKKYEARITSLEATLRQQETSVTPISDTRRAPSSSSAGASNTNSGILDDFSAVISLSSQQTEPMAKAQDEIAQLKDILEQRETFIANLRDQLVRKQQEHEQYHDQVEHDKEDMRLQIHEYEQLLEEERQAYEENTKSFLKEAQIKDNLADIRIADMESEWKAKVQDLTDSLAAERRRNDEMQRRNDELERRHTTREKLMEDLEQEVDKARKEAIDAKQEAQAKVDELLVEMNDSDKAKAEIKQRLAQTREMVDKAESKWMEKQHAWDKMKQVHEIAYSLVNDLLRKLNPDFTQALYTGDQDIATLLEILASEMADYIDEVNRAQERQQSLESNYKDACQHVEVLNDERMEQLSLAVQLASKLDEMRKSVLFEITNQLQLPVDEAEVGAMTKKIITADTQEDMVAWNELLLALNMMDTSKFVSRVRRKVKNANELTRSWQKEYKVLKDKYAKVSASAHEKIAFRNFKVGDVALFLPTRNSSGKPWAAFNINAPHYFLVPSEAVASQMHTREWIVARITGMTECLVNVEDPESNPYGLSEGSVFYQLQVEHWRSHRHRKRKKTSELPSEGQAEGSTRVTRDQSGQEGQEGQEGHHAVYFRRYTVPNVHAPHPHDMGLASISSSAFMDPRAPDNQPFSPQSVIGSPSAAAPQAFPPLSSYGSPNIVHSTTMSTSTTPPFALTAVANTNPSPAISSTANPNTNAPPWPQQHQGIPDQPQSPSNGHGETSMVWNFT